WIMRLEQILKVATGYLRGPFVCHAALLPGTWLLCLPSQGFSHFLGSRGVPIDHIFLAMQHLGRWDLVVHVGGSGFH
ncbi:MAG: hypothetical protein WBM08_05375, partial [Prochlorococcaceae cyanobacterium]